MIQEPIIYQLGERKYYKIKKDVPQFRQKMSEEFKENGLDSESREVTDMYVFLNLTEKIGGLVEIMGNTGIIKIKDTYLGIKEKIEEKLDCELFEETIH